MAMEGSVRLPVSDVHPLYRIARRLLLAVSFLFLAAAIVWLTPGYTDEVDGDVTFPDALYLATVSLSTTGYGDITPVTPGARAVHTMLITPLRVLFLIVLIGTTVETLATHTREQFRINRWRKTLRDHTVVVGYGVKGRSAIATLLDNGVPRDKIVVVDPNQLAANEATDKGLSSIVGDATRAEILNRAEVATAKRVVVTTDRDDTNVLVTLTARQLNADAEVSVAVREAENAELVRHSGANTVVPSSDAVGRILGLSAISPPLGHVLEDLLATGEGLEVAERDVTPREEGRTTKQIDDVVLAVIRDGNLLPFHSPAIGHLVRGDRIIVVRSAETLPWAPRAEFEAASEED
ncbi:MAG TPA: potassium channel family protein [Jiangellaceae bacterium]